MVLCEGEEGRGGTGDGMKVEGCWEGIDKEVEVEGETMGDEGMGGEENGGREMGG